MLNIPQEIGDLLKTDGVLKNFRVTFPDNGGNGITNDKIIMESVQFDESIMSRSPIKFGLCEASCLQFSCVDVNNIKGKRIRAQLEVDISSINDGYDIYPSVNFRGAIYVYKYGVGFDAWDVCILVDIDPESATFEYMDWGGNFYYDTVDGVEMYTLNAFNKELFEAEVNRQANRPAGGEYDIDHPNENSFTTYMLSSVTGKAYQCTLSEPTGDQRKLYFSELPDLLDAPSFKYMSGAKCYGKDVPDNIYISDDVPFWFYRIPLGDFIVDSCKRDAQMLRREVVAYSASSFDTADPKAYAYNNTIWEINEYGQATQEFNVFNYLALMFNNFPADWFTVASRRNIIVIDFDQGFPFELEKPYIQRSWVRGGDTITMQVKFDLYQVNTSASPIIAYNSVAHISDYIYNAELWAEIRLLFKEFTYSQSAQHPNGFSMPFSESVITSTLSDMATKQIWCSVNRDIYGKDLENADDVYSAPWGSYIIDDGWYIISGLDININCEYGSQSYHRDVSLGVALEDIVVNALTKNVGLPDINMVATGTKRDVEGDIYYFYNDFFNDLNVKNLLESYMELAGVFGGMDRYGNFKIYDIIHPMLLPNDRLLPSNNLYPTGSGADEPTWALTVDRDLFISAWYDESLVQFYRIICKYKNENDENDTYEYIVNYEIGSASLPSYDLSNNLIISKGKYTRAQIASLVAPLIESVRNLRYYESEVEIKGLPYVEAGDYLYIETAENRVFTPVFRRTLSGIQDLRDQITSL